jgi:cobalt-zinc-cadmium efflux system outer membrane protein
MRRMTCFQVSKFTARSAAIFYAFTIGVAAAQTSPTLPTPLSLDDVTRIARENRSEVVALSARAKALSQRPAIVGALEDPMLSPAIDHYPFEMMEGDESGRRYDWSIAVEQRFPLSGVRGHRRRAARAEAQQASANVESGQLDVALAAQRAFFMVHERRRMSSVIEEQLALTQQLVSAASARYGSGTGMQADVLRAEVEVARAQATQQSLVAQLRAAEAMLNVNLGRQPEAGIPTLDYAVRRDEPLASSAVSAQALKKRPELQAGAAEVERASAEIDVMRSMYLPMATVRVGRASTMAEGPGAMIMVGVSVPIWRKRLHAGVAEAKAMERMANADLQAMQLMIAGEAVEARESVIAARTQVTMLETEIIPRARGAVDASLAGYRAGQSSLVSVIESSRALWEARAELVMAETALGDAWAKLARASGQQ